MVLLSAWGTLRVILILVIVWQVLRIILRMQQERAGDGLRSGPRTTPPDGRSKGEVRIERADRRSRTDHSTGGPVEDADFKIR